MFNLKGKSKTIKIVYIAMMTALVTVATMFTRFLMVPATNGYVHLADGLIVFLTAIFGIFAIPASAIGSFLADILLGGFEFSLFTLVIKGLMSFVAYLIFRKNSRNIFVILLATLLSEAVMLIGYFFTMWILFGSVSAGVTEFIANLLQAGFSIIIAPLLITAYNQVVLKRVSIKK